MKQFNPNDISITGTLTQAELIKRLNEKPAEFGDGKMAIEYLNYIHYNQRRRQFNRNKRNNRRCSNMNRNKRERSN